MVDTKPHNDLAHLQCIVGPILILSRVITDVSLAQSRHMLPLQLIDLVWKNCHLTLGVLAHAMKILSMALRLAR